MVCLNTCTTLRRSPGIARMPRGLEESAAGVAVYPTSSSAALRAVQQACFMRICQACSSRAHSISQAVTIDSYSLSLVKLSETKSYLCRFRSILEKFHQSKNVCSCLRRDCSCILHSHCSVYRYEVVIEILNKPPYMRIRAFNSLVEENNSEEGE